jgi:nitronate monooxygenase
MLDLLARFHERLGIPPPSVPAVPPDPFPKQLEVVLDERPAAFSFTFGVPPPDALLRLRSRCILSFGTATTVDEAKILAEAGVDGVVAQGAEAGGHRGTFAARTEEALTPTLRLVAELQRVVSLPIIATGGIMEGREIYAALQAGAAAAQLGTAFLACPESGASLAYKHAIITAGRDRTVLTRAFSGRWARGLANEFTAAVDAQPDAILPYPLQNQLTRAMRLAAGQKGEAECLSLWVGQGVARVRQLAAGELVRVLAEELRGAGRD